MRSIGAAIPLAIALLGAGVMPDHGGTAQVVRMRLAADASMSKVADTALDVDELRWLEEHNPYGMPQFETAGSRTLIVREGYTLAHDNVDRIADWVTYHLTDDYVRGTEKRPGTSAFKPDPLLQKGFRAEKADYKGWNGVYDRGHQCASADSRGRGARVIKESFYLSNMTPQAAKLNRNGWRLLEARIQELAKERGELWVMTGPAFVDDDGDGIVEYSVIGEDQVAVPTHYYKIVLARKTDGTGELEAMAFLIPNREMEEDAADYLVSVDEVEELTGIDFLRALPDSVEDKLEASTAGAVWPVADD